MNNEKENTAVPAAENKTAAPYKPGEKGFAIFWLIFGGIFFYLSLKLHSAHPGIGGAAAIPLFCTGSVIVCALLILLSDRKAASENDGAGGGEKVKNMLRFLFSPDVLFMLVMILLYCVFLNMGIGFYPVTAVFLFISMMFYQRSKYRRDGKTDSAVFMKTMLSNVFWTAVCLGFILAVFSTLFKVVLP